MAEKMVVAFYYPEVKQLLECAWLTNSIPDGQHTHLGERTPHGLVPASMLSPDTEQE